MLRSQNNKKFDNNCSNLHSSKNAKLRNNSTRRMNKKYFLTFDSDNNKADMNFNSPSQKKVSIFIDTNNDSIIHKQTHSSYKNIFKEIKASIVSEKPIIFNNKKDIKSINKLYSGKEKLKYITYIQNWWKTTFKIIFIQKYVRRFLIKRRISIMVFFIKNIYIILFKLVINKIKYYNINNKKTKKEIINNKTKKNYNNKKTKKNEVYTKNNKSNYYIFSEPNNFCNKSNKNLNHKTNYTNNAIKRNNKFLPINNIKEKPINKNKKINKEKKEKEIINNNNPNKGQLITGNIYNYYNNVRKSYGNINNHNYSNSFTTLPPKSIKNDNFCNNNKKIIRKKIFKTGSMINLNENKMSKDFDVNIDNNQTIKIDRRFKNNGYFSPNNRYKDSLFNIVALKKVFLFWKMYAMKKLIIAKLIIHKNLKTKCKKKKKLNLYNDDKKKEEGKSNIILTKKIVGSNSLIDLKLNSIKPKQEMYINHIKSNSNLNQNINLSNISKKANRYIGIENNNSMKYLQSPKSNYENKLQSNHIKTYSHNLCNNDIKIISQYNRSIENKKKKMAGNINRNICINENKKIYYFYAIINLIDNRNRRKKLKTNFNFWKSLIKFHHSFIANKKIEEKIISFKSLKSPNRKDVNENDQKLKSIKNLVTAGNYNCQTEAKNEINLCHFKAKNNNLNPHGLLSPNSMEKIMPQNNYKSSKIVYQKKFLVPKKARNQSLTNSKNINYPEEDMNIMAANDNKNIINYFPHNTINKNSNMTNNYDLNKIIFMKRNNYENNDTKKGGRINTVCGTEGKFHSSKNSFIERKKFNINKENESNNININIIENYRNTDVKSNIYKKNDEEIRITTKKISLKSRKYKNLSQSQELRNDQNFYN